jgi:gas vesicle protein
MKTAQTLVGILGGVAVGAALGVLFAPDKGSNTRKNIAKKSTDAADKLKEKAESVVNAASDKYDSLVNKGKEAFEKGTDSYATQNIKSMNKDLGI